MRFVQDSGTLYPAFLTDHHYSDDSTIDISILHRFSFDRCLFVEISCKRRGMLEVGRESFR